MDSKETIDRLNAIEERHKERIEKAKTTNIPWDNYLTNSPSRLARLSIVLAFAYHAGEYGKDVPRKESDLIDSLMDKKDWEYMQYYCADGRYQKWVSEMQAKAPDKHPIDWEYED